MSKEYKCETKNKTLKCSATGYAGLGTVGTCYNIDECSNGEASCPANSDCIDTPGSYICSCRYGYRLNGDVCENIDECKLASKCKQVSANHRLCREQYLINTLQSHSCVLLFNHWCKQNLLVWM